MGIIFLLLSLLVGPTYVDITDFGARSIIGAVPQTLATCTSGQPTVTLAAASTFQNGDGVTIYNCGMAATASSPTAPTVIPGQSKTFTVPDAVLASDTSGANTYSYALVTRDAAGGLSAASLATTITNGATALGQQTFTIVTISLAIQTLTVVTTIPHGLVAKALVHITGVATPNLNGWYPISSVTNPTTFVVDNMPLLSTLSDNTGSVNYYKGNQVTFTNPSGGFQSYVCAQRPGDTGLKVIGVTPPFIANWPMSTTFTDWGATITSKPNLPSYVADSICTGNGQHDPLTTTIVSGAGTTSLRLAANASNNACIQLILYTDGPAFSNAISFRAEHGGALLIPIGSFHIN